MAEEHSQKRAHLYLQQIENMKHTITGSSHFESKFRANQYYSTYGFTPEDVQSKINSKEISIGQPPLAKDETCVISTTEGRYMIYKEIKVTYPPLEKLDCSRGAPMGRANMYPVDRKKPIKVYLRRVRLDSGGYDQGHAYWGHSGEYLYRAACPEEQECSTYGGHWETKCYPEMFVWAKSRAEALNQLKETLPKLATR